MQMIGGSSSGSPAQTYDIAGINSLVFLYQDFGKMAVNGFKSVVVPDKNQQPITAESPCEAHFAIEGTGYGIAFSELDIGSSMIFSSRGSESADHFPLEWSFKTVVVGTDERNSHCVSFARQDLRLIADVTVIPVVIVHHLSGHK